MSENERIAARAVEIAEELRKALPLNTDFGPGWQQRYLDRQNERYEKALEMARAEVAQELPPGELTEEEWRAAAAEDKAARGVPQPVGINGPTEAEASATASVMGIVGVKGTP